MTAFLCPGVSGRLPPLSKDCCQGSTQGSQQSLLGGCSPPHSPPTALLCCRPLPPKGKTIGGGGSWFCKTPTPLLLDLQMVGCVGLDQHWEALDSELPYIAPPSTAPTAHNMDPNMIWTNMW